MTAKELIESLQEECPDAEVRLSDGSAIVAFDILSIYPDDVGNIVWIDILEYDREEV